MNIEDFTKLGFNKNEAIVYLALIELGIANAHDLISKTKFHKNIVYDNLEKLIDKGLVTFILEGKKKVFQISSSKNLIEFFEEKEKEILKKKEFAKKIVKEIDKTTKSVKEKQEARIYKGIRGIKSFYNETLDGSDYIVFGAPHQSIEIMGETFWRNYNLKRNNKKIKVRMIFNPSIKDYGNTILDKFTEVKYFDKNFEPQTETHVQNNKVGIIVWTKEPILFLIENKDVASSYKKFFEDMWKSAKK